MPFVYPSCGQLSNCRSFTYHFDSVLQLGVSIFHAVCSLPRLAMRHGFAHGSLAAAGNFSQQAFKRLGSGSIWDYYIRSQTITNSGASNSGWTCRRPLTKAYLGRFSQADKRLLFRKVQMIDICLSIVKYRSLHICKGIQAA